MGKVNFKDNLKKEVQHKTIIGSDSAEIRDEVYTSTTDTLEPKVQKKKAASKKSFPVYMPEDKVAKLDSIGNQLGYSRNELINKLIDKGLEAYGL